MTSVFVDYEKYTELFCLQSSRNYFIESLNAIDFENGIPCMDTEILPTINANADLVNEIYENINDLNQLHNECIVNNSSSNLKETLDEISKLKRLLDNTESEEVQIKLDIDKNLQVKSSLCEKQQLILKAKKSDTTEAESLKTNEEGNQIVASNGISAKEKECVFANIACILFVISIILYY